MHPWGNEISIVPRSVRKYTRQGGKMPNYQDTDLRCCFESDWRILGIYIRKRRSQPSLSRFSTESRHRWSAKCLRNFQIWSCNRHRVEQIQALPMLWILWNCTQPLMQWDSRFSSKCNSFLQKPLAKDSIDFQEKDWVCQPSFNCASENHFCRLKQRCENNKSNLRWQRSSKCSDSHVLGLPIRC